MKKRTFMLTAAIMLAAMLSTGCNVKFWEKNNENADNTGDTAIQFAELKDGETLADIEVEGFGIMTFRFFPDQAPLAVENFLTHAKDGYYDGVSFHRVMADFMIQGGDPTGTGRGGESIWNKAFEDEFSADLEPFRGALCMANSGKNTNGSQFFVVQADAASVKNLEELLSYKGMTLATYLESGYGTKLSEATLEAYRQKGGTPWLSGHHTVFGQLIQGYDVLDSISNVSTDSNNSPLNAVIIKTIKVYTYTAEESKQ